METSAKPIVASTSLSFLLHGLAFAGLVLAYDYALMQDDGLGQGLDRSVDIQLVSSLPVADQQQADVLHSQEMPVQLLPEKLEHATASEPAEMYRATQANEAVRSPAAVEPADNVIADAEPGEGQSEAEQMQPVTEQSAALASVEQASAASQQPHLILALLHQRISENKAYPYLARRQRREGIATVAFVLHPDGRIENPHVVTSSRATSLDRAALSAVKHIEPFTVARDYIAQPEQFQVDIEFDLL